MTTDIPMTTQPSASKPRVGWLPFVLIALVVVPGIAGAFRLIELFGGPRELPADPRLNGSPAPVVIHIVCALTYAVLGAFQFSAGIRRRNPGWHSVAGRVLIMLGLAVALSGLWMTVFYDRDGAHRNSSVLLIEFPRVAALG